MAGFGDKLLAHLKTVPQSSTEELAKLGGVSLDQAYGRLMALSYEKRVISAGKGKNRAWSLPDGAPTSEAAAVPKLPLPGNKNHGWKPDLSRFEPLSGPVKLGDKLLVEYPEEWRHTMLCSVVKLPGYIEREPNIACVWNLRDDCYSIADVVSFEARGWKISRVKGEKDLEKLANES